MKQIHLDAIRDSRLGAPRYVVKKGAYYSLCKYGLALLDLLKEGYQLQCKYVSGVGEYAVRIDENTPDSQAILRALSAALFDRGDMISALPVIISVQEFYDELQQPECKCVCLTQWQNGAPGTVWVSPKDRIAEPQAYTLGQQRIERVMDIIQLFSLQPDTRMLLHELELDRKKGALK